MTPIRSIGAAALTILALGAAAAYGEANQSSQAQTNREQAPSQSSASGPGIADNQLGPKVTCSADARPGPGQDSQRKSEAAVAKDLGLANVQLLEGSCHSRPVRTDDPASEARTSSTASQTT